MTDPTDAKIPLKRTFVLSVCLLTALFSSGCFQNYRNFNDWYWHSGANSWEDEIKDEERTRIFGHFMLPTLIWQPAGGLSCPGMDYNPIYVREVSPGYTTSESSTVNVTGEGGESRTYDVTETRTRSAVREAYTGNRKVTYSGNYNLDFLYFHGGALDLIPYRAWFANDMEIDKKLGFTILHPVAVGLLYGFSAIVRVPMYAASDVYKTLMLPIAYFHYKGQE